MIRTLLSHSSLHAVENAIRPLVVACRLVPALAKASSAADAGSRKALHQQAAAASPTQAPNLVHNRSDLAMAGDILATTGIAGQRLKCDPMISGHTSLEDGCRILLHRWNQLKMIAKLTHGCDEFLNIRDPRYLGNYPDLIALAGEKGMCTGAVRNYLRDHPEILAKMGITKDELKYFHIDHILPQCKGGRDHPRNYFFTPAKVNCSYGGRLGFPKCWSVGPATLIQVVLFHQGLDAMLMG